MTPELLVDVILAVGLVALSLRVVTGGELFRDIVVFIVFGLVVALSWARLGSPDLALAEAAIGAGVTGALMLMAYRRLASRSGGASGDRSRRLRLAAPVAVLAGTAVAIIGLAALGIDGASDSGGAAALAALPATGLGNPVTGVLLMFRGLDTLLELVVLLVVLLGAWAMMIPGPPPALHLVSRDTPLVAALLTIAAPLCVLVAVHLLVVGADEPGGAFQAGAVLAAGGVLLVLTGVLRPSREAGPVIRLAVLVGPAAFVVVGVSAMAFGRPVMELPGLWAVYLIETAMMISIAVTLSLLFGRSGGFRRGGP